MDAKQSAVVSCNVAEMLNAFGPENSKAFIQKMSGEHRSLQQRFTALCVMWLRDQAADPPGEPLPRARRTDG